MKLSRSVWAIAISTLLGVAVVKTRETTEKADALEHEINEKISLARNVSAFKGALLGTVRAYLEQDPRTCLPSYPNQVVAIVNTTCRACETVVEEARGAGLSVPLFVASFSDDPSKVANWLKGLGSDLTPLECPADSTVLRFLPREVTPVFLEFIAGKAMDVHIGQLKDYWTLPPEGRLTTSGSPDQKEDSENGMG